MFDSNRLHPATIPGRWPAVCLAVLVHLALFLFLWIGIRWHNNTVPPVAAEVWEMPATAAQQHAAVAEKKIAPTPAEPPKNAHENVSLQENAEIVLEKRREKKRKEILQAEEKKALAKKAEEKKIADTALAKLQIEKKRTAEKAEQVAQKEAAQKIAARKAAVQKEAAQKEAEEAQLKQEQNAQTQKSKEQALRQKIRSAELEKMQRMASSAMQTSANGAATKAANAKSEQEYQAAIIAKIRSNLIYGASTNVSGNPRATFRIEQLPSGEINGVKKITGSGILAFDEAIERAIRKSSPLPKRKDGTVARSIDADVYMKE